MEVEVPNYEVEEEISLNPTNFVVLVVDMQNDFAHPDGPLYNPDAEDTIEPIADLLDRARTAGCDVWYTRDTHTEDDPEFDAWGQHCVRESWGWKIVEELQPVENDLVFNKSRYDGFYGTDLDQQLRINEKQGLVIVGTVANICVHYTAASAGLRYLTVVHPVDLVSALTEFDYHASLRQAQFLFQSRLVKSEHLIFEI